MEFKYNNLSYWISKQDTINDLLERNDLISFSLSIWKVLLEQCYQHVDNYILLKILKKKIEKYDTSSTVNSFLFEGIQYWLDKNTRLGLIHLANCSTSDIELVLGDKIINTSSDKLKSFLSELEIYAGKCFVNTQKHLNAIKELKTVEDIINYDYTSGYPEKITLTL